VNELKVYKYPEVLLFSGRLFNDRNEEMRTDGGLYWFQTPDGLINIFGKLTERETINVIAHETIHWILDKFVSAQACRKFDNLSLVKVWNMSKGRMK